MESKQDESAAREDVLHAIERAEIISNNLNDKLTLDDEDSRLKWLHEHVIWSDTQEEINLPSLTNELGKRKLFYSGRLVKSKSGKNLFAFLFNDFLLMTSPVCSVHEASKKLFDARCHEPYLMQYREVMPITEIQAFNSSSGVLGLDNSISFEFNSKRYTLKAEGAGERKNWVNALKQAVSEYLDMVGKRERIVGCPDGKGLLKIEVVSAEGIITQEKTTFVRPYIKITLGDQVIKTPGAKEGGSNPLWNYQGQLVYTDLEKESIWISLFLKRQFAPDDFVCANETLLSSLSLGCNRLSKEQIFDLGDVGKLKLKMSISTFKT